MIVHMKGTKIAFQKLLSLLCIICCIISPVSMFSACNNNQSESENSDTLPAESDDKITLNSSYTLIYPNKASGIETQLANAVCNFLSSKGCEIKKSREKLNSAADPEALEIIFGNTLCEESQFELESDYSIRVVGKKLVIKAASTVLLDEACSFLCDKIEKDGLTFPNDYCHNGQSTAKEKLVLAGNQSKGMLQVYDVSKGLAQEPVWNMSVKPKAIAGLKYRETEKFGKVVLFCVGSVAKIISFSDKKELIEFPAASNAHSVEITPNGKILAVASSTGNSVRFFNTDMISSYTSIEVEDAHGVLYDDKRDMFYIIGRSTLYTYKASINATGKVDLYPVANYTIPSDWAHDITPIGEDEAWVSTGAATYIFNKNTGEFKKELEFKDIKGIGTFKDGTVCYIYPDGKMETWTSRSIYVTYDLKFLCKGYTEKITIGEVNHFYKIRPFMSEYTY